MTAAINIQSKPSPMIWEPTTTIGALPLTDEASNPLVDEAGNPLVGS